MADEEPRIEVIYLGRRTLTTGKAAASYALPESIDKALGRKSDFEDRYPDETTLVIERLASLFTGKGSTSATIGGIYSTTGKIEDGRINSLSLGKMRYERAGNYPLQTAWKALDKDVTLKAQQKAREKAAEDDTVLNNAMNTIRYRYKLIPPTARRGFKLWLLDELEKRK